MCDRIACKGRRGRLAQGLIVLSAVLLLAAYWLSSTAVASADIQWFGYYEAKTYRNHWDWYPVGPLSEGYCGGGAWAGTYNTNPYDKETHNVDRET